MNPMTGIGLKLMGTLAFGLMYAAIRLAGPVPTGEVVFFRGLFALIPVIALSFWTIGPVRTVRTTRPVMHIGRALTGVVSMFLNFAALSHLPLADFTAFGFAMPIFAVILAAFVLKEYVGPYRWGAVLMGLIGVMVMLAPQGENGGIAAHGLSLGAGLALSSAFLGAVVIILIRQMHATENGETIVFYFMTTCAAAGALSLLYARVPLSAASLTWLVLAGLLGGIGQIGMTFSYRYAEPSMLAPFDYVAMIWAVALGYAVFAEIPEAMVMAGAAIVIASGLIIIWRERIRHRSRVIEIEQPL